MSLNTLRKGNHVLIVSARFMILKKLDSDRWQLENAMTGECRAFTEFDLLDRFAKNELVFVNQGKDESTPGDRISRPTPPDLIALAETRVRCLKEIDRH